jgi:hypothetical protein
MLTGRLTTGTELATTGAMVLTLSMWGTDRIRSGPANGMATICTAEKLRVRVTIIEQVCQEVCTRGKLIRAAKALQHVWPVHPHWPRAYLGSAVQCHASLGLCSYTIRRDMAWSSRSHGPRDSICII